MRRVTYLLGAVLLATATTAIVFVVVARAQTVDTVSQHVGVSQIVLTPSALFAIGGPLATVALALVGLTWRVASWKRSVELRLEHLVETIQAQVATLMNEVGQIRSDLRHIDERTDEMRRDVDKMQVVRRSLPRG